MPDVALDLRYLRCAIAAAEHGSFRRTALFLDVPRSTVSRRIQMLEGRLGFPLFVRERIGVKLTPAGADFLKDAIAGVYHLSRAAQLPICATMSCCRSAVQYSASRTQTT